MLLLILLCVILSTNCFSVSQPKYSLVYNYTPKEDFDFTDLSLYDNIYTEYSNRNFPLPRYIPQYLETDMFLKNKSTLGNKVIGIYTPRYFDGEKYTNFRIDSYNPRNLTDAEKGYLDRMSLSIDRTKTTDNKCNYMAYWSFTRDFTPDYSIDNSKIVYDVYYYYDLGYWYSDVIRDYFTNDCPYIYGSYMNNGQYTNPLVEYYCKDLSYRGTSFNSQLYSKYNTSTLNDLAIKIYQDGTSTKLSNGKCIVPSISNSTSFFCYSKSDYINIINIKDNWMMKMLSGNYIPQFLLYNGKNLDNHLSSVDERYRTCKQQISQLSFGGSPTAGTFAFWYVFDKSKLKTLQDCQIYVQAKREQLLKLTEDFTTTGVSDMIWKHYKESYNIPKGTNLYPLNIKYAGIRCRENETFKTYEVKPINPNAQSPYVECNYSTTDPQVLKVGFVFDVRINPAFAMISGSDSILRSYDADYLKTMFQTIYTLGNLTDIKISNYTSGSVITAYFLVNRSKENGCTFVYMDNTSTAKVTTQIVDVTQQVQKMAEVVPPEVTRQLEVQVKLLKAEAEKTQFFFYIDIIAKLIFRGFVLFYYIVSVTMLLYIINLMIVIPKHIIEVMNLLGTSKYKRINNSILNK